MDDYSRVLSNPDNLIVSEELSDLFNEESGSEETTSIHIDSESHVCNLLSVTKEQLDVFEFELEVPSLVITDLLSSKNIELDLSGMVFECYGQFHYSRSTGCKILTFKGKMKNEI